MDGGRDPGHLGEGGPRQPERRERGLSLRAAAILFATDLLDEGFDSVVETVLERGGVDGLTMACTYHHSRDVFPHNPVRKVRYFEGGAFFHPDPTRYAGLRLQPHVAAVAREQDPLRTLVVTAGRRGLAVRGWTNNMHSTVLASRHPDCAVQNVFGDPYITSLCPANPDVRAYVRAITADLARYPLETLLVESVCYAPFDHGYHHERTLVPLTATAKYLLSLCFCSHCCGAARARGVATAHLKAFVRDQVDRALNGEPSELDAVELEPTRVRGLASGELGAFLEAREAIVTTLVEEMTTAAREVRDMPLVFMEWSGGLKAVGVGIRIAATPGPAIDRAWQDGVRVADVARACDGLALLGYVRDAEGLRAELEEYRKVLPAGRLRAVALRPMPPDCASTDELHGKLRVLEEYRVDWVDFYHYGFMRLRNLDWIGQALRTLRQGGGPAAR